MFNSAESVWITRDTIFEGMPLYSALMCLLTMMERTFHTGALVARYDVALTSFKITSLNLNTFKEDVSKRHTFCLIVYKNNVSH